MFFAFVLIVVVAAACWVAMVVGALAVRTASPQGFVLFGPACAGCGYSLTGLGDSPRCPECGVTQSVAELRRRTRVRLVEWPMWRRVLWWSLASHLPGLVGCVLGGDSLGLYAVLGAGLTLCSSLVASSVVALVAARRVRRLTVASALVVLVGTVGLEGVLVLPKAVRASQLVPGVEEGALWFSLAGSAVIAGAVFAVWCCGAAAVLAVKGVPGEPAVDEA